MKQNYNDVPPRPEEKTNDSEATLTKPEKRKLLMSGLHSYTLTRGIIRALASCSFREIEFLKGYHSANFGTRLFPS